MNKKDAILRSAIAEFKKGYRQASLRVIAQNADATTGTIYSHYHSKQELFETVVGEAAIGLKQITKDCLENLCFDDGAANGQLYRTYYTELSHRLADFVHLHSDAIEILIMQRELSTGDLLSELCSMEMKYSEKLWSQKQILGRMADDIIYLISMVFYSSFFELLLHDTSAGFTCIDDFIYFHIAGWDSLFERVKHVSQN